MLELNTVLYTKDGRKIGNAIVIKIDREIITIKTDYGNNLTMTYRDVEDLFYFDFDNENFVDMDHVKFYRETHKNYTNEK